MDKYKAAKTAIESGNAAAIMAAAGGDFENALVAATPGGIEAQEKQGQTALVSSFNRLPFDGMARFWPALEALGFTNQGLVKDDIFVNITAPEGWTIAPTDHSMWSDIKDAEGRKRGGVFYKAAFYDRSAHFSLMLRYTLATDYGDTDGVPRSEEHTSELQSQR